MNGVTKTGVEGRRLAIEIIATLAYRKADLVEFVLKPAEIPPGFYRPLMNSRDEGTGKPRSKRQIAPLLLDALDANVGADASVLSLARIAAAWTNFHLSNDEYEARATVAKARDWLGQVESWEKAEQKARDEASRAEAAQKEAEQVLEFRNQSRLLEMMFDELGRSADHQARGYQLQDLLNRLFDLHGIQVYKSFTRNEGAEQIDGAFKLEGWYYIVECRWRQKLADTRELDGLVGNVGRSGRQTMGLFLSIEGWSENVPRLLKQNPEHATLLMNGYDLRHSITGSVDLKEFLGAMIAHLNLAGEPHLSVHDYLSRPDRSARA